MKRTTLFAVAVALAAALAFVGCAKQQQNDQQAVNDLLTGSDYTNDTHVSNYGANDTTLDQPDTLQGMSTEDGYGRIPFVRFRRYIPTNGIQRQVKVQIPAYPGGPDTTALATITWTITGELRTMFDTTTQPINIWRKPFTDFGTRKVYLEKYDNSWHIKKISPLKIATQNAAYNLNIISIHAVGLLSHDTFDLTTTDTLLTKAQLPWFEPGDTVVATVTVRSDGDSCWAFLYHGQPLKPRIWREPYWRTGTWTFERAWLVRREIYSKPCVRPSINDAIGWGTLWADTSKPYVSASWGIPYIIRMPVDTVPSDD
jgi:hypothetical protein